MSKIEVVNWCSGLCAIGPAAKEIKKIIVHEKNKSQNHQKNQKNFEDLNLKEIHKEQINLRKHINKICHRNNFKHLAIPNGSFIVDQKRNFAYCLHAKVIYDIFI